MRDLLLFALFFGSIPYIFKKPFYGILLWTLFGLMNPHKLTWGAAYYFSFAVYIAAVYLVAFVVSNENKKLPITGLSMALILFVLWASLSTLFADFPENIAHDWNRFWKVQLFTFLTIMALVSKERIILLVGTIAFSLGFYGVKGGIFTLAGGGSARVWGPEGTFIGGNNEIGLALIMTVPLINFLRIQIEHIWIKRALMLSMILCVMSILGTQSRGALVGLVAMTAFIAWKSNERVKIIFVIMLLMPIGLFFMPETWWDRIATIGNYEEDGSAMGRINAWWFAFYYALDNPFFGGGFGAFDKAAFLIYAPEPFNYHDAHSIYFEVLGEQGFVGLFLFLLIGILSLRSAKKISKNTKNDPELKWMSDLASMVYVSLIGYATCGAFLGLAYFDLYYMVVAILIGLQATYQMHQKQ